MKLSKSAAAQLLSTIIKQYAHNKRHLWSSCEMSSTLRSYIIDTENKLARHVASPEACFVVKAAKVGPRVMPMLHIVSENSGSLIMLPKSKLIPAAKPIVTRAGVLAALRESIDYQIKEFRFSNKLTREKLLRDNDMRGLRAALTCPLTGKYMAGTGAKTHVDHCGKPFIQIADEFVISLGLGKYEELAEKLRYKKVILKPEIEKSWKEFHQNEAHLQLVNGRANVKKGSAGYKSVIL